MQESYENVFLIVTVTEDLDHAINILIFMSWEIILGNTKKSFAYYKHKLQIFIFL